MENEMKKMLTLLTKISETIPEDISEVQLSFAKVKSMMPLNEDKETMNKVNVISLCTTTGEDNSLKEKYGTFISNKRLHPSKSLKDPIEE